MDDVNQKRAAPPSIVGAYKRKEYGWFGFYISAILISIRLFGGIGGAVGGTILAYGLYKTVKNTAYSTGKKIIFSTGYIVGGIAIALAISLSLVYGIKAIWGPSVFSTANLPSVSSTTEIPVISGYKNYQNQTMTINFLRYLQDWILSESSDKLSFTLESPDKHVDVTGTLYAESSQHDLQSLIAKIKQGAQQNGIVITNDQIKSINGRNWLEYDYKTQTANRAYDNRVAIYILPQNNTQQFIKLQLESNQGYFPADSITFDSILSSINFAN